MRRLWRLFLLVPLLAALGCPRDVVQDPDPEPEPEPRPEICEVPDQEPEIVYGLPADQFESWVIGYCDHVCHETWHLCDGDDYQELVRGEPWDDEACMAMCIDMIDRDIRYISNLHCHASTCQAQWECFEAEPQDPHPDCVTFCDGAERCGMLEITQFSGSAELCAPLCDGGIRDDTFVEEAACLAEALGDSCDADGALDCFEFGVWTCLHACEPGGHHVPCPAGTAFREVFPTDAECMSACEALPRFEQVAFETCIRAVGCDGIDRCWPPPEESAPGCTAYCTELLDACPRFDYPSKQLCEAWCSGAAARLDGFPGCTEVPNQCPISPNDLVRCPVEEDPVDAECESLCSVLSCCFDRGLGECLTGCPEVIEGRRDEVQACLSTSDSCDAFDACID